MALVSSGVCVCNSERLLFVSHSKMDAQSNRNECFVVIPTEQFADRMEMQRWKIKIDAVPARSFY